MRKRGERREKRRGQRKREREERVDKERREERAEKGRREWGNTMLSRAEACSCSASHLK